MDLKYLFGTKESREKASKNARDNLKDTIKKSIFCAPRGFFIFLLAFFLTINHSITGNQHKKQHALYAMYHNTFPFLEVTCLMIPIMYVMHSRFGKLSNLSPKIISIISPFICLAAAFTMCMSLRLLGIREDCCSDIDYGDKNKKSFFDEDGNFKGIEFKIPPCSEKKANLPQYFTKDFSSTDKAMDGFFTRFIFKGVCSILYIPLFFVQIIDLIVKFAVDICTQMKISDSTKRNAKLEIPCSFYMIWLSFPFCENLIGKSFNSTVDSYISNPTACSAGNNKGK